MSQIKSRLTCNKKFPSKFNIVDPFKSIEVLHSVHTSESYSYRIGYDWVLMILDKELFSLKQ